MDFEKLCEDVIVLSKNVGQFILNSKISQEDVEVKSINNLVSFVDKQAEKRFVESLSQLLPESGFLAEEGTSNKKGSQYNWIIDPLDGTTNFIHNVPAYCTSVALLDNHELVIGVIYNPISEECFSAVKGKGSFLNGSQIQVSSKNQLSNSLLATGFPYDDFERQEEYMELLKYFTQNTRGLRRLGSAAIDLAFVACGRFDAFYEYGLNPWDIAAGLLIVEEAGGKVTDFKGDKNALFGTDILASNSSLHSSMQNSIANFF